MIWCLTTFWCRTFWMVPYFACRVYTLRSVLRTLFVVAFYPPCRLLPAFGYHPHACHSYHPRALPVAWCFSLRSAFIPPLPAILRTYTCVLLTTHTTHIYLLFVCLLYLHIVVCLFCWCICCHSSPDGGWLRLLFISPYLTRSTILFILFRLFCLDYLR